MERVASEVEKSVAIVTTMDESTEPVTVYIFISLPFHKCFLLSSGMFCGHVSMLSSF
jgi:hypothetical protein